MTTLVPKYDVALTGEVTAVITLPSATDTLVGKTTPSFTTTIGVGITTPTEQAATTIGVGNVAWTSAVVEAYQASQV